MANHLRIAVLGMGYVGLSSGMALARNGFKTICTTTTRSKADNLNKGIIPFFEPGLEELVKKCVSTGMLSGSIDNIGAVKQSDVTFICVGTPSLPDGSADLSEIKDSSKDIGEAIKGKDDYHLVVAKSTIPPGTTEDLILPILERYSGKTGGHDFGLCMNPEFLREGEAVHDSLYPDRIVIGQYDERSGDMLENIFKKINCPIMRCDIRAAEMIKYASNSLLATKISFANEFARICEKFDIDVYDVMKGVGLDFRINPKFLNAGVGFGGSCFPKDISAIVNLSKKNNVETPILDSVIYTNRIQPNHLVKIIEDKIKPLEGKTAAILGLSFKPNTDDVRNTRALPIIESLEKKGVKIKAYDPKAIDNFKKITKTSIEYYCEIESAIKDADFIVIQSDWKEIREYSIEKIKSILKSPIIFDGRRTYDPVQLIKNGITYYGIGWKNNYMHER